MRFPYRRLPLAEAHPITGSRTILRPIVSVRLGYGDRTLVSGGYQAMIDSGADWCMFHAEVARILRVPLHEGDRREVVGVGGGITPCYFHPVRLLVGAFEVSIKAAFAEALTFPYGLLGQSGFFDRFVVTFNGVSPSPYVEVNLLQ